MMGKQSEQKDLFSYSVDLDRRVRADHPLRRIAERIDFTFVRQQVKGFYGYNGNESVDPAVLMKMMFLLFYDNVSSERELMRIIAERLDYMWFLGYRLDGRIAQIPTSNYDPNVYKAVLLRVSDTGGGLYT